MDLAISYSLARILGVYLFLLGAAMLINPTRIRPIMKDFIQHKTFIFVSGLTSILLGMIVIILHNVWIEGWPVFITLLGWVVFLNGIYRLFFLDHFMKVMKKIIATKKYFWFGWICLLLGAYLAGVAFLG